MSKYDWEAHNLDLIRFRGGPPIYFSMMDMVAKIFNLYKSPRASEVRHLWTAISNVIDCLQFVEMTKSDSHRSSKSVGSL